MPSKTDSRNAPTTSFDDIDNYFLQGDLDDDPFASPEPADRPESGATKRKEPGDGLGIDEEVSVAKKARVPRIKLDQERYAHLLVTSFPNMKHHMLIGDQVGFTKGHSGIAEASTGSEAQRQGSRGEHSCGPDVPYIDYITENLPTSTISVGRCIASHVILPRVA